MNRTNLNVMIINLVIYALLAYFLISLFPFLAAFVIIIAAAAGLYIVIRYLMGRINHVINPGPEFDEFGSRKTKSTVVEMKESEKKGEK